MHTTPQCASPPLPPGSVELARSVQGLLFQALQHLQAADVAAQHVYSHAAGQLPQGSKGAVCQLVAGEG